MSTWGIIPAAGAGSRIQPLAFSKELLPVGSRFDDGVERPRAVCEYLVERMIAGGATKICFVISPGKSDILEYFGGRIGDTDIAYVVQPHPAGLCDALFRAAPFIGPTEHVLIGLPDTIWFPTEGFTLLPDRTLSFLLFPVEQPQYFDAVVTDTEDKVLEIQVKQSQPKSSWIWGAVKMDGASFHALHDLWQQPGRSDEYLGTLVNAYLDRGGEAMAVRAGLAYVDVGTLNGYREAIRMLNGHAAPDEARPESASPGYTDGWRPLTARNFAQNFPQHRVGLDALHRSNH
jgi:dTDP-glucose pyrophosphorylase